MVIDKLWHILGSNQAEIDEIISQIDSFYKERKEYKKDKNGNIRKNGNGEDLFRLIRPSYGKLKIIQSRLQQKILSKINFPEYVTGSVKKRSNITNALMHKGKKYKFQTDLRSFFDTVTNDMVYKSLLRQGFNSKIAHYITRLTTYKGCLPQGTPTSPALANLAFLSLDEEISNWCKNNDITYSRYVDDLTLSSQFDFKEKLDHILGLITSGGFKISHKKTSYKSVAVITGVEVSQNNIKVTQEFAKKKSNPQNSAEQLKGFEQYEMQVKKANEKWRK